VNTEYFLGLAKDILGMWLQKRVQTESVIKSATGIIPKCIKILKIDPCNNMRYLVVAEHNFTSNTGYFLCTTRKYITTHYEYNGSFIPRNK
jgi:hypothetical protein